MTIRTCHMDSLLSPGFSDALGLLFFFELHHYCVSPGVIQPMDNSEAKAEHGRDMSGLLLEDIRLL